MSDMATVDYQRNILPVRRVDGRNEEISKNGFKVFQFKHTVCHACCGFYGPCFSQPLCTTCHAFLFPDIDSQQDYRFMEKSDSEDSGNDEPTDFYETVRQNRSSDAQVRPRRLNFGPKVDRLAECISALSSTSRNQVTLPDGLAQNLPEEVLSLIFYYLDDLSLWNCGQVCKRWNQVIEDEPSQDHWTAFVKHRWPLFKPRFHVQCWKTMYRKLLESSPCMLCLFQMSEQIQLPTMDSSWRAIRLQHELKQLQSEPPEGIEAIPLDRLCCHWQASITGPADSPYEGGHFFLYLQIPASYPMDPPVVRFLTKIFHPNISRHGDIGIDSIHDNWSLALTISKILISIQSLLTDPYCHVCMEPEVGRLYSEDRKTFERTARLWTLHYAMNGKISPNELSSNWHTLESG